MTDMIKLSIIVPVFNAEQFLKRCLDSIVRQNLTDFEIICINDNSTDNSLTILEEYDKRYSNVRIINLKENGGVSKARNEGIKIANGEYLGFVDADDYVDDTFFEKLYNNKENNDIVKGNIKVVDLKGRENILTELNNKIRQDKYNFYSMFWSAIYRTDFIKRNNLFFDEDLISGQVGVFLANTLTKTDSIKIIDGVFYHYIRTQDSLVAPYLNLNKIKSRLKAIDIMIAIGKKNNSRTIVNNAIYSIKRYYYKNTSQKSKDLVLNKMLGYGVIKNKCKTIKELDKFIEPDFKEQIFSFLKIPILKIKNDKIYLFNTFPIFNIEFS
jgi:glycosyltransferase involved in cell wall biosynthesis